MIMALLLLALGLQAPPDPPFTSERVDSAFTGGARLPFQWKFVDDGEFLRRLMRDLTGREPSEEDLKAFVSDAAADKRPRKIDQVLDSEAFAASWARRLADVLLGDFRNLRIDLPAETRERLGPRFIDWLKAEVKRDRPYTEIVRELITAEGTSDEKPALAYKVGFVRRPEFSHEFAVGLARRFLGIRLQCARCHDDPYNVWSEGNLYALAAFGVRQSARVSGGVVEFREESRGELTLPGGSTVTPSFLFGGRVQPPETRIAALGRLLTSAENTQLPRAFVNRVWGWLFGRAIFHPADDFTSQYPSTNEALVRVLTKGFSGQGYSQKALLRTVLNSRAYQLVDQTRPVPEGEAVWRGTTLVKPLRRIRRPERDRIAYEVPADWIEVPSTVSDSRKHEYRVPDKDKKARAAELTLYKASSAKELVEGWARQMTGVKRKEETVAGNHPVTLTELSGIFNCTGAGDPPTKDRLLAGAVQAGAVTWVFRLLGPEETVDDWRAEFVELIKKAKQ